MFLIGLFIGLFSGAVIAWVFIASDRKSREQYEFMRHTMGKIAYYENKLGIGPVQQTLGGAPRADLHSVQHHDHRV